MMNPTIFTNDKGGFERRFLLEDLPQPLTRASEHLQFFDNHLTDTNLLLRKIRFPKTKKWTWKILKTLAAEPADLSHVAVYEIELSEYEYQVLSVFEGNELRYNRYFYEFEECQWQIDMYLNRELWNLILATVKFSSKEEMQNFSPPAFIAAEITQDETFLGARLADSTLDDIKKRVQHL
jgi:CYTH domain-containing protein